MVILHPGLSANWSRIRLLAPSGGAARCAPSTVPAVTAAAPSRADRVSRRLELKYCVPADVAEQALRIARAFLSPERHGASVQRVTSLYLDTPDLMFLRWHRDRRPERFKLRVRAYGSGERDWCFAEVKHKVNGVTRKQRARVAAAAVDRLVAGDPSLVDSALGQDTAALTAFIWQMLTFQAEPKVLVSCERESLRGNLPGDETAVTVDRGLVCRPGRQLAADSGEWRAIPLPLVYGTSPVLLEIKYADRAPAWMRPLLQQLAPGRVSFSKYMNAMSRLTDWETR